MVGAFSFIQTTFAESPANRIYFFENQICLKFVYFQLNVDREVLYIEVSLKGSPEDFSFHPAKFDNFKDEYILKFKTIKLSLLHKAKTFWTENCWSRGIMSNF